MRTPDLLLLLGVILLWGGNFVVAKIGFAVFPPLLMMTLRFAVVAVLLVPFYRLPRRHLRSILILSVTLGSFHFGCMFYGVTRVEAGTAALLTQFQVPFSAVLAAVFLNDRIGWRRAGGMAVAFAGLIVIAGAPDVTDNLFHVGLVLAASLSWALGAFQIKRMSVASDMPIDGQMLNCWIAVFAVPQMLAISLLLEDGQWDAMIRLDWRGWFSVAYMAVAVVIIGYGTWYRMLGRYALSQVMPVMLLVPVVSIVTGIIFLDEDFTWRIAFGGVLIILGVAVILIRRPRTTAPMPNTSV